MIHLFHGDDSVISRTELLKQKQTYQDYDIRELDGKNLSDQDLIQALSSDSLFSIPRIVVIDRMFGSIGKKIKRVDELLEVLKRHSQEVDLLLWEDRLLAKGVVSKLQPLSTIHTFTLPAILFQTLDRLTPQTTVDFLKAYRQVIAREPAEVVHVLLVRRLRQMIAIKQGKPLPDLQDWQRSRLTNQAGFFTMKQLLKLYQQLLESELSIKTGTAILALPEATELAVATL